VGHRARRDRPQDASKDPCDEEEANGNGKLEKLPGCPAVRQLVTLQDAGNYITKLPKVEHEAAATEVLSWLPTLGGPTMLARIGVMRALNRNVERTFNAVAKTPSGESGSWRG
jgi:hypothetical protein